jgi:transposase
MLVLDDKSYKELQSLQKKQRNSRFYKRITAILMISREYSVYETSEVLGIDETTIYRYRKQYEQGGRRSLLSDNYMSYEGKLMDDQLKTLDEQLSSF